MVVGAVASLVCDLADIVMPRLAHQTVVVNGSRSPLAVEQLTVDDLARRRPAGHGIDGL
jgi:hypothetical protein